MYLLAEGAGKLIGKLESSELGKGFADWVEKNRQDLLKNRKVNPKLQSADGAAAKPAEGSSVPKEKPADEYKPRTNAEKGVFGEAKADEFMAEKGYKKLNGDPVKVGDEPLGQGIDGVWKNPHPPPDYVITEAKYGSSKLGNTQDGPQMSDKWINNRLDDAVGQETADQIRKAQAKGQVEKWLLRVDEKGAVTQTKLK